MRITFPVAVVVGALVGAAAVGLAWRHVYTPGAPMTADAQPKGDAVSIPPDELDAFDAVGLGGEWYNAEPSMLENTALTVRMKTAHGQKLKLQMMRGGAGLLGRLGAGDGQQAGIAALATWVRRNHPER